MNWRQHIFKISILLLTFIGFSLWSNAPVVFSQGGGDAAAYLAEVVALTNTEREKAGLPPLTRNPLLDQAAQAHAESMAHNNFHSHDDPVNGTSAADRITGVGYPWMQIAENIAAGQKTPAQVVTSWMNSPGHRKNILDPGLKEIGVGYYYKADDTFPQPDAPYRTYWVQGFGTRSQNDASDPVWNIGDVFVSVGGGKIKRYSPDGQLLETYDTGVPGVTAGMAFDAEGNLFLTHFAGNRIFKLANTGGAPVEFATGCEDTPESIIIAENGKMYVGLAHGKKELLVYSLTGELLGRHSPETEEVGVDWIDLASDLRTLFYTSEGSNIKRYDLVSKTQLPDFNQQPLPEQAFALRILPDGGVLLADGSVIVRLSKDGKLVQQYDDPGEDLWFAINLDPDGKTFWSGGDDQGKIYRFGIESGKVLASWDTGAGEDLAGVAVYGEIQAAQAPVPTPTPSPTPTITPSPTPVPTNTPTPTITPTPGIFGAPTPTPETGITRLIPLPTAPSFCSNHLWWLPALVLPFLLALLLLLFLWWLARRNHISLGNLWQEWRWPCRITSLLLLLLLLFLAFLVGRELFVGTCRPAEAVYFWRLDPQTGDSGIFLTTNNNESGPQPFKSLNRGRCVGCHAVSSQSHQIAAVHGPIPGNALIYSLSGEKMEAPDAEATYYAWSPDGKRLAYADSFGDIYIWDTESHQSTPLQGASDPNVSETMPSWFADGETIAFVRSEFPLGIGGASVEGDADIYTIPATGGQAQRLPGASGEGMNYYPAYSPDGKWLAFTHHTTGSRSYADEAAEIFLVPATGGDPIRLEANGAADGTQLENVSNSWPTWSLDGHLLAFNSKRDDPNFDVFFTEIDETGHSGVAQPLPGASQPGVFEHTPFWGEPLQPLPLWKRLLSLWPWLIPLLLLALLRWLLCRKSYVLETPPAGQLSGFSQPPELLSRWRPHPPEWRPAPTLVIGLGGAGRKTLTHLKKNLLDAGLGAWPEQVRLLLLDNAAEEIVNGQKQNVSVTGVQLEPDEMIIIGDDLRDLVRKMAADPDFEPEMQSWFPADEYARVRSLPDAQMDIRKTTHQRRPMGRAVAFKDIQQGNSSQLWQSLTEAMRGLAHDGQVRVLIIGSLAGGFGSGVLADVAYLTRRAAQKTPSAGGAVISALLVTDNAFVQHTRSQQLQLNTQASLRELGRLLLAGGRPFPMVYKKDASEDFLNGYIEWSLFDDVFLFDGQRPAKPLTLIEPEQGMFPLLADIAQVFIDEGSQLMEEVRSNIRTTAATVQVERGEAVISTLGAYTYRLPMLDIVRGLAVRFAHDLVLLYLAGPDHAGRNGYLTPEQARRETRYPGGLPSMVLDFLRGDLHGQSEGAGAESSFVADLAEGQDDLSVWRGLTSADTRQHQNHFRKALRHLFLQILNGQPLEKDITSARAGKLGYALAFLEQLSTTLHQAQERLDFVRSRAAKNEQEAAQALAELISNEIEVVAIYQKQLQSVVTFLLGSDEARPDRRSEDHHGVLSLLQEKLAREKSWREELRQMKVRHTFIDEAFVDKLYAQYFADLLDPQGLAALYWRADDADSLSFSVFLEDPDEVSREATRSGREAFIETLIELAATLGESIWRVRLDDFFDDQDDGLWQVDSKLHQEVQEAAAWSEPAATVRVAAAAQQEPNRYLWVNDTVTSKDRFARQVQLVTHMRTEVQHLSATDPYSATLLTSLDILPLSAFDCTQRVEEIYRNAFGLGEFRDYGATQSYPEPVHVFAAEQHALVYERRLPEIHEAPRLFHPLFVAALEDLDRARTFVWAYLLQWVRRERYLERGEPGERYVLVVPGIDAVPLTRPDRLTDSVALIVRAMQSFVLGKGGPGSAHLPYSTDEIVSMVRIALETHQEHLRQAMRDALRAKPEDLAPDQRLGADDFWSFLGLIARDELRNR